MLYHSLSFDVIDVAECFCPSTTLPKNTYIIPSLLHLPPGPAPIILFRRAFILNIPFPLKHNDSEASTASHGLRSRIKYVVKLMLLWDMHIPNCNIDCKYGLFVVEPSRLFYESDFALSADNVEIETDFVEEVCCHFCNTWQEPDEDGTEHHLRNPGQLRRLVFSTRSIY
jgi:hypothetical protein